MKDFIKDNIDIIIEAPLIMVGILTAVGGYAHLETDFMQGLILMITGAVIITIEKIFEYKHNTKK